MYVYIYMDTTLYHTANHCKTLHRPATHCTALHRTATHCNRAFVAQLMNVTGVASGDDLGCSRAHVSCHTWWGNRSWGDRFDMGT